jgi:zinc protease
MSLSVSRRRVRPSLYLAAALAVACAAHAPSPPHPEDVLRRTLDNGLRVVVVRNRLAPVVTTVVNYEVGSNEAPADFPGTAHALEHMMFRGAPGLSGEQLADIGAALGGRFDADTKQTLTQYFFTVPAEDLEVALHIESLRMQGVLASQEAWERERGAIEQEVAQDLSNPEYVLYERLLTVLFAGTPYSHDALGTRPSFDATTGAMLAGFHERWYAPNNAVLVIVGDVEPAAAADAVERLFGAIPSRPLPPRPVVDLQPVAPQTIHLESDLPVGLVVLAFRMPGYASPDYAASEVLADALGSERGPLYALVPAGKALSAGFDLGTFPGAGLAYAWATLPAQGDPDATLAELSSALAGVVAEGVDDELVAAARRHALTQAELAKDSVSGLAMAWSDAVALEGRSSPADDLRAIEAVRTDQVSALARSALDPEHALTAVLTPGKAVAPHASQAFGGVESFAPERTRSVVLPDWASEAMSRLSVPESTVHPVVERLANGIELIVQPETVSEAVSVYGHIRNEPDLEVPPGREGVERVLDRLLSYGTATLDRVAYQAALDAIGARVTAGTDFSLQVLASDLDAGVGLLADNEIHPRLPESAFPTVRKQVAATVAGERASPGYRFARALDEALYPPGDPSLREATAATVSSLQLEDAVGYHQKVFRPDLTTIVVIGKTTPEEARAVIERHFGGWSAEGEPPPTLLPPAPSNGPARVRVPDPTRVQDQAVLAETLNLVRKDPDYDALELGNHVLGGAFYATRLYQDLREQSGLVYYVSSSFDVGRSRGVYAAEFGCDPPNVQRSRGIVLNDLRAMQSEPVSAGELRQAKTLMLREIPLSEASIHSIAGGLLSRVDLDLPLDEPTRAARRIVALDAEAVRAAFSRWLRPDDLVEVIQGPPASPSP